MEVSLDPYEQKLFQMFKSHDTTNTGLDETSLIKLCNSLELSDRSNIIVKSLINRNDKHFRVDFKSFKEALLIFLGTEMEGFTETDKALTLVDEDSKFKEKIVCSGPDSPGREISPKLIMGAKKYGRRSRPQSIATDSSLSETDDENTADAKSNRVQRSSSHSDMHNSNGTGRSRRRPTTTTNTKLKRCASLPAQKRNFHAKTYAKDQQQKQTQHQTKSEHEIKSDPDIKEQKQLTSSVESLGNIDFENLSHTINEIWLSYTNESNNDNNFIKRDQLESLCERIGLFHKVAGKMADEVFDKLNLNPKVDRISFDDFIGLLHGADTDEFTTSNNETFIGTSSFFNRRETCGNNSLNKSSNINNQNNCGNSISITATPNFNFKYDPLEVHNNTQDSLCTLVDSTANNRDLQIQVMPVQLETIPFNSIIEMWENSAIHEPKTLLVNLGFEDDEVNVGHLIKILEEEINSLQNSETQKTLLKALLVLEKAEVASLQLSFKQLCEENKKLHADNKDANKRAALLAQEIDERHANLEDSTKTEIRLLEQKHSEILRDLTSQMAADRENWSNLNIRLECRIKLLEQDEQRLKSEIQTLQEENSALEKDQTSLQKQITDLLEDNIKLNNEITSLTDKNSNDVEGLKESDELLELMEKISSLQIENTNLRDKNDELTADLENINMELIKLKMTSKKSSKSSGISDSTSEILSDDAEHASSLAIKRRGDSPSKAKLTEESPRTGKLRKCNNDSVNSESETSGDWVALNSELGANNLNSSTIIASSSSGFSQDFSSNPVNGIVDEELKNLREKIFKLELELKELKTKTKNSQNMPEEEIILKNFKETFQKLKLEKENLETRCKDLESSLDQMRKAYEDCEDYWQNKLNDERQIFEKERQIYEDEQNESDKKFSELMEKVREYEEQFSKDGRLSPIEEKDELEQQYMNLEAEIEEIRFNAKKIFEEKAREIESLKMNVQELKLRLGDSVDITQVYAEKLQTVTDKSDLTDSPASSPISYLWNQSTIQAPVRDYQNPNWNKKNLGELNRTENLTTSETSIFSTPIPKLENEFETLKNQSQDSSFSSTNNNTINPIQKPISATTSVKSSCSDKDGDDSNSLASGKSYESQSANSTHSLHKSSILEVSGCSSSNDIKEELKRLKFFEVQLREQIKDLALKRDSLVMELQQLQEAKPVLEKAYARAAHPTLIQRVNLLEQKNRHLQTQLRQQQQYTDSILQQTWHQQRNEVTDLRNRLESQGILMAEQAQRLANSDMLVKDLYVENSHLSATIQRLEQQRSRANIIQQHQQKQSSAFSGVSGMP
ncbi:blastoderm-specific protein 25D isoform X1 [Condylostylus longicornis]|uniref:blastoderm-specific protein 25D isoform X1 n=1 Tax=Condylostylus longicornis TaxID=2530218 RepID=UPI00244E4DA0|nr:blastoderm-specific protein 25D isoform X1 [Condylostylus longicornis]